MKDKTLDSAIKQLIADNEQKINAEKLRYTAAEKTGIEVENVIGYSDKSLGFGWRKPLNKDMVKAIFQEFPIDGKGYEMKFSSSSKNFTTDSSLVVKWNNSHEYHHTKNFDLCYESNGKGIKITVPVDHFGKHVWYRLFQGKHKGFGRYETFNDMFIDYFYTQQYSGGYNTLYFLEGAESLAEYQNFVITGEFKYAEEIN